MRKLLENRLAFGATVLAFVLATGLIAVFGTPNPSDWPEATLQANDPTLPPDPWCPSCPPPSGRRDETLLANDPTLPPDPWCPSCPPPSGRRGETLLANDPTLPPDPWCPSCPPPSGFRRTVSLGSAIEQSVLPGRSRLV